MKNFKKLVLITLFFTIPYLSFAQKQRNIPSNIILNYGFEHANINGGLVSWKPQNIKRQYLIQMDKDAHSEAISVKICPKADAAEERGAGLCNTFIPKQVFYG